MFRKEKKKGVENKHEEKKDIDKRFVLVELGNAEDHILKKYDLKCTECDRVISRVYIPFGVIVCVICFNCYNKALGKTK